MRPSNPVFNSAYGAFSNAIVGCNFSLQAWIGAYFQHLFGGQFSCAALFASVGRSVFDSISKICDMSIPAKVANFIVGRVPIVVAGLMPFRRWTCERKQYEAVNLKEPALILFPQKDAEPSFCSVKRGLFHAPCFYRSHAPNVRDFVNPFVPNNWLPSFHRTSILVCGIFYHGT